MRHGCKSLVNFELLDQPPEKRAADNPWPQWPKIHRTDYGHEESIAKFGADPRNFAVMSKEFVANGDGGVGSVRITRIEWQVNSGQPKMIELDGTAELLEADLVLLAMGFLGPERYVAEQLGIELDRAVELPGRPRQVRDERARRVRRRRLPPRPIARGLGDQRRARRRARDRSIPDGIDAAAGPENQFGGRNRLSAAEKTRRSQGGPYVRPQSARETDSRAGPAGPSRAAADRQSSFRPRSPAASRRSRPE